MTPRTAFLRMYFSSVPQLFDCGRDAHRQLDELVVEEGHPALQTDAHAHLVHPHQQQLGEPQVEVDIGHPVEVRRLPCLGLEPLRGSAASASHESPRECCAVAGDRRRSLLASG